MSDLNKKVIDIFSKNSFKNNIKNDLGYSCIDHLIEYSKSCSYIIRVMKEHNGETVLFNYNVPGENFMDFISKVQSKHIQGTIIEIDKYFPEDLA